MNRFLTKCLMVAGLGVMLASCKKNETQVVANTATAGTLKASASTIVLNKAKFNKPDTSVMFTITNPDYGYNPVSVNSIQMDIPADNWANPVIFTLASGETRKMFTTTELNNLLIATSSLKFKANQAGQIVVRMANTLSKNVITYSTPVTLTVTPFSVATYVYVPGAYQGWSPDKADSLASPDANDQYSGIINFTGSDLNFKLTAGKSWSTTNYGKGAAAGALSTSGDNLAAPAAGGLLLNVDTKKLTITYTPQWSIIGDATPGSWDKDTNLFLDKTNNTWYITVTLVSDGTKAMKFRFNNKWDVNLGGSGGKLTQGGDNLVIPKTAAAGDSYKVTLNATANTYTLTKM